MSTAVTAAQRGSLLPANHDTAGSSPTATKKAIPIKSSIDDTAPTAAYCAVRDGDTRRCGQANQER